MCVCRRGFSLISEELTDDPLAAEKAVAAGEVPPEPWLTQTDLDRDLKWLTDPESAKVYKHIAVLLECVCV